MWNSKIWLKPLIWWMFKNFRVISECLSIFDWKHVLWNRKNNEGKNSSFHENFQLFLSHRNKIVTFSQLIVKNFHLRCGLKEKTVHSMKIFNFSCHIENKIVTFLTTDCNEFSPKMWSDWLTYDVKSMMLNLFHIENKIVTSFLILV